MFIRLSGKMPKLEVYKTISLRFRIYPVGNSNLEIDLRDPDSKAALSVESDFSLFPYQQSSLPLYDDACMMIILSSAH
jgi:hypothetical protein